MATFGPTPSAEPGPSARPTVEEWLARTRRRPSAVSTAEVLDTLDEQRGPWLDARR